VTINNNTARSDRFWTTDLFIIAGLSLSLLLYHLFTSALSSYGYFVDELYYIACSKRLAFGYLDHPPLSILLLALNRWVLGDSLPAIRFLPALALAATVFVTGIITRSLGGTRTAMVIASLAVIAMPVYLLMGSFYSMNAFEILLWTIILYLIIRLVREENPKIWPAIGLLMGIGLEMKHTMVLYAIALVIGMFLTPARRFLLNKWFVWAMVCSLLLLLPNLVWQYANGFPSLEFYRNAMVNKNISTAPLGIVLGQVLFAGPFALPLWIIGLVYFFSHDGSKYRFLGWTYLVLFLVMVLSQSSRPDRIAAIYPALFAGGVVAIQRLRRPLTNRVVTRLMLVMLLAGATIAAPLFTPLLSPPVLRNYMSAIGFSFSVESGKVGDPLPQWLGDRLGWHELASEVSRVYHSLSPEEQRNTVLVSTNYGEAGALELYGKEFGLPPVFATHNSFHMWGPPSDSIKTYIAVFVDGGDLERKFISVSEAGLQTCEYCTRPQQRIPVYVARGPKFSITKEWPTFKIYN
jgi:4-amino-4-deoxy-L-arabinose transferase-like glycosyltransferase